MDIFCDHYWLLICLVLLDFRRTLLITNTYNIIAAVISGILKQTMNSLHEGNDGIDSMRIAVANNEMDVDGSAGGNTSDSDQEEYSV